MEHRIPNSQTQTDLPMVVYLQGDEEFIIDFEVDADRAMDFLGIKRSRLTQISGRELRVGRIRKDRYIRPMYRVKDLEDYKSWTRATATSQSSSKVMEKAVSSLSGQWTEFKLETQFLMSSSLGTVKKEVVEEQLALKREMIQGFQNQKRIIGNDSERFSRRLLALEEAFEELLGQTKANFENISNGLGLVHTVNETLHLDVHKISQGLKGSEERVRGAISELNVSRKEVEGCPGEQWH